MNRRTWFVTCSKGLVVRDGDAVLSESDVIALGLDVGAGHPASGPADTGVWVHSLAERELPPAYGAISLRALHGTVGADVFTAAVRAVQIATFVDTHRFCGRCATRTVPVEGERSLRCPSCELVVYPRISPAIIVLVRRGAQALLARSPRFPTPFYSTLAGFVEVGETLEETLAREVREEVGIEVRSIRYFGSQPWPFPHQLMVGFTAEWSSGDVCVDGIEIADAKWFEADALPTIPPKLSIARQLIDAWVDEVRGSR